MVHYRRTQLETICDVLELCSERANKHQIVYNAELTTKTMNKYLNMLLSSGFLVPRVVYNASDTPTLKVFYETTESGVNFLEVCLNVLNKLGRTRNSRVRIRPLDRTWMRT